MGTFDHDTYATGDEKHTCKKSIVNGSMRFLLEKGGFRASFTMVTTMVSESPKPGVFPPSKWPKSRILMEIKGRDVPSSILPKKK